MRSRVAKLAFPLTLGVLADSLLSLAGLAVVSRISTEAVAAVGLSSYLFFVINAVLAIFMGGVMVVASQALGGERVDVASEATGEALGAAVVFSALLASTAPFWLNRYLLLVSGGNEVVAAWGYEYALMRMLSLPALALNAVVSSLYRSARMPWPTALYSIISSAVGAVLLPAFTFQLNMGLAGAGLATAISSYAGFSAYAFARLPLPLRLKLPRRSGVKVLLLGLPSAAERIVASVAQNVYLNAVARGGTAALAAHNIGITVESLVFQPSFALSMAALVEAGRSVGASDSESTSTIVAESVKVSAVWMGLAAAALALASPFVGRVFTSDESVAQLVMAYLLLAAASEVGLGVSQALFGAIRGMGSVWLPFAISSFTVVFLRALPAQLLSLRYGAIGAWVTQNTDMYGRALLAYLAWKLLGEKRLARKVV
ncbi:MAG: MATE family efflux transporter [Thermofilaceae archaeon]